MLLQYAILSETEVRYEEKLQTAFTTRQYMLSKDFEIYYYNEKYTSKIEMHTHNYYEFYFS